MNMKKVLGLTYATALLAAQSVQAATYYWDGTSASWNTLGNWSTASGATTPDPLALPSAADDAIFNITPVNGAETITLDADQAVGAITFNNTGTTQLTGNGTDRTLTLGMGGITIASVAGAVTLGDGTAGNNVLLSLATGAQTWLNNSGTAFTINNTAATFTRATGATLTFNKASTGNFALSTTVLPLVNSIAGPWAFFGTGTGQKYAKITSGNITGLTGTTASTINSMTSATANYEYTKVGTTYAGVPTLAANTIRTSLANGIALSSSVYGPIDLPLNGILAVADSGTFTISQGSRSSTTKSLQIGNTGELVIAGQQAVTLSAPIYEGLGAGRRVVYSGTSILTLSGVNTYTGGTMINSGTVKMGASGTLGTGGLLTLSGGALDLNTTSKTVGEVSVIAAAASGDTIRNGSLTGTSYAASNTSGDAVISASLLANSTAGFTKSGAGTVTLSGNNTYTGGTIVSAGTLAMGCDDALASGSALALSGGTFDAGSYTNTLGALTLSDGTASQLQVNSGTCTLSFTGMTGTGTLDVIGTLGATSVRFGTDASTLNSEQRSRITINSVKKATLNALGYLIEEKGTIITFI